MNDQRESARAALDSWRSAIAGETLASDRFFRNLLQRHLGARYAEHEARLERVARRSATELDGWVSECGRDEHLPRLQRHDAVGRALEQVVFHPSYHEAGRVFWSSGVLAVLAEPGHDVLSGALAYLLDRHGEGGHACPVACTAGAIKLLQAVGSEQQRQRYLPRLLDPDYDRRLHAAQFVTEIQGGSDVGLNACVAIPDAGAPGSYRITGEKWFCSVADAGLFVVSARVAGAPPGTAGLGLFLVPRTVDGAPNGFALRRLKWKLGTRSMATGEIEFDGALAEPIGPLDAGFKNLVAIVLDTSRVHNAVAACGIMRRAFVEARTFAEQRTAFERRIVEFPAVQEILARMRLSTATGLASTFRILALTERQQADGDDETLGAARRIAVMINKYRTALQATRCARDGIEVLGGNGTIEDFSPLPRLYRDAIVIESWEGTHNTLCAQVLRDMATRRLHEPWLDQLGGEIDALDDAELQKPARELREDVAQRIEHLLAAEPLDAMTRVRHVVDRMCRLSEWVGLAAQARWEASRGGDGDAAELLELYRRTEIAGGNPETDPGIAALNRRLAEKP